MASLYLPELFVPLSSVNPVTGSGSQTRLRIRFYSDFPLNGTIYFPLPAHDSIPPRAPLVVSPAFQAIRIYHPNDQPHKPNPSISSDLLPPFESSGVPCFEMPWSDQCGKVMKKPGEYSKNPNTIRARARKARLTPFRREIEQAKASDSKAITRAWKIRTETEAYKMASAGDRKAILEKVEHDVMQRRREKGYDAETKINRFLQQHGSDIDSSAAPSTPTMDSHFDQRINMGTPASQGYPMQPMAPMAPMQGVPLASQAGSRFATPGSFFPHVMSSAESSRAGTPRGPPPYHQGQYMYGAGHDGAEASARYQMEAASDAMSRAHLMTKVKELEKTVKGLTDDLVLAKSTISAQEKRMADLHERMLLFDGTASGMSNAEAEFAKQAGKLRNVVNGVQTLAQVAAKIYADLADGSVPSGRVSVDHGVVEYTKDGDARGINGYGIDKNGNNDDAMDDVQDSAGATRVSGDQEQHHGLDSPE
ncbi:hypothetical protein JX266_012370 [Neoarthrinium moseri]|nr:hypothetical protein JX266_012370 [Neoarthrinium moseri]